MGFSSLQCADVWLTGRGQIVQLYPDYGHDRSSPISPANVSMVGISTSPWGRVPSTGEGFVGRQT